MVVTQTSGHLYKKQNKTKTNTQNQKNTPTLKIVYSLMCVFLYFVWETFSQTYALILNYRKRPYKLLMDPNSM